MASNKSEKRGIELYIDGEKVTATLNGIRSEIRKQTKELNAMTVGTEAYNRQAEKIRNLKGILREHTEALRDVRTETTQNVSMVGMFTGKLGGFLNAFNQWFNSINTLVQALGGLTTTARRSVADYAAMQEAEAQVVKYTGLAKDEVKELNEELKRMDTRTTRDKLNALAGDAGRLGITAQDAVLEFVDAGDKINVALGEDLGEDAVQNIGKLAQMFGESDRMGLRAAMLATGSAINEVAQNSSSAEAYLVDFTARVAGAAHQAGLSQADIIGFASVMDENMLRNETSATAFQNIIMKMFTDTDKFARIAGVGVKEFSETLRTDANAALLQFMEGLSKQGGLSALAPIFGDLQTEGAGVSSILSVMAGKVDDIRERQELANKAYEDGTSIINEFNVQNNTVQAGLDKAKKKFAEVSIELGERLEPIAGKMISTSGSAVRILNILIDVLTRNLTTITAGAAAITLYTVRLKAAHAAHAVLNTITKAATVIKLAYGAAQARVNGFTVTNITLMRHLSTEMKGHTVLMTAVRAATTLWAAAVNLLNGRIDLAGKAFRNFTAIIAKNPFGLIAVAVTAATVAITRYIDKQRQATDVDAKVRKVKEEANKTYAEEAAQLKVLHEQVKNNNLKIDERRKALEKLHEKVPGYLGELTEEGKLIHDNTDALKAYLAERKKEIIYTAYKDKWAESVRKEQDALDEQEKYQKRLDKAIKDTEDYYKKYPSGGYNAAGQGAIDMLKSKLKDAQKTYEKAQEEREAFETKMNTAGKSLKPSSTSTTPNVDNNDGGGYTPAETETETEKQKRIKAALATIEADHYAKLAELKKQYLTDSEMTEQDYAARAEQLEQQKLQKMMTVAGLEPKQREEINNKIIDYKMKLVSQLKAMDIELADAEEAARAKELAKIEKHYQEQLSLLKKALAEQLITQEEYQAKIDALNTATEGQRKKVAEAQASDRLKKAEDGWKDQLMQLRQARMDEELTDAEYAQRMREARQAWIEQQLQDEQLSAEDRLRLQREAEDLRMQQQAELNEKEMEQKKALQDALVDVATGIGQAFGDMFSGADASMKEFLKSFLNSVIDALHMYIRATYIKSLTDGVWKPIQAAKNLAKIAAIEVAFAGVKALVNKFDTGGFTPSGRWDEPQGVVHSNEFVANRFAVGNPQVRPVLDLIDRAQRSGSISSLTGEDIAAVAGRSTRTVTQSQTTPSSPSADTAALLSTLARVDKTMRRAMEAYRTPSPAYCYTTGRGSVNEAQQLLEKMKDNAKR